MKYENRNFSPDAKPLITKQEFVAIITKLETITTQLSQVRKDCLPLFPHFETDSYPSQVFTEMIICLLDRCFNLDDGVINLTDQLSISNSIISFYVKDLKFGKSNLAHQIIESASGTNLHFESPELFYDFLCVLMTTPNYEISIQQHSSQPSREEGGGNK